MLGQLRRSLLQSHVRVEESSADEESAAEVAATEQADAGGVNYTDGALLQRGHLREHLYNDGASSCFPLRSLASNAMAAIYNPDLCWSFEMSV